MEKYYVLERFSLMKSSVLSAIDSMTVKRKAIEKNQKSNNIPKARELYQKLEKTERN